MPPPVRRRRRGAQVPLSARVKARIIREYTTPGTAVAFSTPARVADKFGITLKKARDVLEEIEGYTRHREYKKPATYNPYYVHTPRDQVQGDLIDIAGLAGSNRAVRFLLVLIDIMTKKLWVYPIKNKAAPTMKLALSRWLASLTVKPKVLQTDQGTEFTNRQVQQLLRDKNVEWQKAIGTVKASIAERVNKTLQILIFKYLTEHEKTKYIDVLPDLVQTYNSRGHRTLKGMTPNEADDPANRARVQAIFHERYTAMARKRKQPTFKVGEMVRVKLMPRLLTAESRAYAPQFKGEYFVIRSINRRMPIPLYHLRSLDTNEDIEGGLYGNELQRVKGDLWRVERVLRRRVRNGRRELFVKWKFFNRTHNSWIAEADVGRVFRRR